MLITPFRSRLSKEGQIQVFVNNPVKEAICLQLYPSTSISDVKGLLQDQLGIQPEKQHLVTMKGFEVAIIHIIRFTSPLVVKKKLLKLDN